VTAAADSTDGKGRCEGTATLDVPKGGTTRLNVDLTCKGGGNVTVGIGVNCLATPLVDFLVSPLVARIGESVLGNAVPARPDGGALTFTWSAPSGTFSDANAAQTMFTCTMPGT